MPPAPLSAGVTIPLYSNVLASGQFLANAAVTQQVLTAQVPMTTNDAAERVCRV